MKPTLLASVAIEETETTMPGRFFNGNSGNRKKNLHTF
jgi:hypothetical protein